MSNSVVTEPPRSSALATKGGTFITGTAYRGAADPAGADWWATWTNYDIN